MNKYKGCKQIITTKKSAALYHYTINLAPTFYNEI
jgi:hypothetical protein